LPDAPVARPHAELQGGQSGNLLAGGVAVVGDREGHGVPVLSAHRCPGRRVPLLPDSEVIAWPSWPPFRQRQVAATNARLQIGRRVPSVVNDSIQMR
jgi:hypothetical protein